MTQPRDNLWGTLALALGLGAFVGALASSNVVVGAVILVALVLAAGGIRQAVRVDYGIARSIAALLVTLLALAIWVFSRGGSTAV